MAESENLILAPFVRLDDAGKSIGFVRAGAVINARPETNRIMIRMADDREVGCDVLPGAWGKRTPQQGDMYVIEADATASFWPGTQFRQHHRRIGEHDIPGSPGAHVIGQSAHPAVHPAYFREEGLAPFTPAIPTTPPPLSSWENPEDAPKTDMPNLQVIPDAADGVDLTKAARPPATPINRLEERENKPDPVKEQPALANYDKVNGAGGGDALRGPAIMQAEQDKIDEHGDPGYIAPENRPGGNVQPDSGFGHYSPPADNPTAANGEFERAYPPHVYPNEVQPAAPSPEPVALPANSGDKPVAPANMASTIQYRDPVETDAIAILAEPKPLTTPPKDEE